MVQTGLRKSNIKVLNATVHIFNLCYIEKMAEYAFVCYVSIGVSATTGCQSPAQFKTEKQIKVRFLFFKSNREAELLI